MIDGPMNEEIRLWILDGWDWMGGWIAAKWIPLLLIIREESKMCAEEW